MHLHIITIFPSLFDSYLNEGLIKKGIEKGLFSVTVHDLRKWSGDRHGAVDDRPFGGGSGMVMKVGPIYRAVSDLRTENSKVIFFTPRGKRFTQKKALEFSKTDNLIMICGRYEGVDARVEKYIADENISMGSYVLMGGEIPAMAVMETVVRLLPGTVGKEDFLKERINEDGSFTEYKQYTRPEVFSPEEGVKWKVPQTLLSGNHKKIERWKTKRKKTIK